MFRKFKYYFQFGIRNLTLNDGIICGRQQKTSKAGTSYFDIICFVLLKGASTAVAPLV